MTTLITQNQFSSPQGVTIAPETGVTRVFETGVTQKSETLPKTTYFPARNRSYKPRARRCKSCGQNFTPKAKHARFCSDRCRKAAWRKHSHNKSKPAAKMVEYQVVVCACCGKSFFANDGKGAKHCTPSCRTKAWRERREAAVEALVLDMGIQPTKAADLIEVGGMRKITAYLTARGYAYDVVARAWFPSS
jgi:hypothetical protein